MYKQPRIIVSIMFIFMINFLISDESDQSYTFHEDDTNGLVDEIRIDFNYLDTNIITAENSIYIYINNKIGGQNITWDTDEILSMLSNSNTILYKNEKDGIIQTDINNNFETIKGKDTYRPVNIYGRTYGDFGGSASYKINNQIKIHTVNNIPLLLELPLIESINNEDILRIFNIPILLNQTGNSFSNIQSNYYFNSDILKAEGLNVNIEEFVSPFINTSDYIIKSTYSVELAKNYKFNDSDLSLPISFDLEISDNITFKNGQHFIFKLNNSLSFNDDFSRTLLFANNKEINKNLYSIYIDNENLNLILRKSIDSSRISFKKVPIITKGKDSVSTLQVLANFDATTNKKVSNGWFGRKSSKSTRNVKKIIKVAESSNNINIHNIDFWFGLTDDTFTIINASRNDFPLPILYVKQNDKSFIKEGDVLNIIIPKDIDLSWNKNKMVNNSFHSSSFINNKNIQIILKQSINLIDTLKVEGLIFKNSSVNTPLFKLQAILPGLDNSKSIFCKNDISIGEINVKSSKSQVIFSSEKLPKINKITISTDTTSSIFNKHDSYYIDIKNSNELNYKVDQDIKSNFSGNIKFEIDKKRISFKILKDLPRNTPIVIENILFDIPSKSEQLFRATFGVIPGNFKEIRIPEIFEIESDFKIFDISLNLFKDNNFIKDINTDEVTYKLSDLTLTNSSPYSFENIDNIKISIDNFEYSFINENTKIISSLGNSCDFKINNNYLSIDIAKLGIGEKIQISDLKIKIKSNQNSIINKPLLMELSSKDQSIKIETSKTITFSAPTFRSNDIQLIYENQQSVNAYQIKIDFSDVILTSRRIKELLIKIPENIDIKWSNYRDVVIESNNILYSAKSEITSNEKNISIIIPNSIPIDQRSKMIIGNLSFKDVGFKSEEFKLQLSIDKGLTFCAIDNKKQIVSESNSVVAIEKIFKEKFYPFKKGNTIEFIIKNDAPFVWDDITTDIYLKGRRDNYLSDITPKSKMFSDPVFLDNNKRISFTIENDIDVSKILGAIQMDFGKKLFLNLKVKKTSKDIGVYKNKPFVDTQIETIYGKQVLKGQKTEGFHTMNNTYFKNPKYREASSDVVLKLELKPDSNLGHPIQIKWYRNKTYLLTVSGHKSQDLSIEEKIDRLTKGFEELQNFYNKDFDKRYVNQDWLFWYYLSFYKCRWDALKGNDIKYPLKDPLLSSTSNSDFEMAEKFGYNPNIPSVYPVPCKENVSDCKIFYENVISFFNNNQYNEAYNLLYDEIYVKQRLLGCDIYEVLSRYLFAILSSCAFEDHNIINGEYSFSSFQLKKINADLDYGDIRTNLENFINQNPDVNIRDLFLLDPIRIGDNCSSIQSINNEEFNSTNLNNNHSIDQSSSFKIKWIDPPLAVKNNWQVSFTDKVLLGDGKPLFLLGTRHSNYLPFNSETFIYGGKTYKLEFDSNEKEKTGIWSLGIAGALTILFLNF